MKSNMISILLLFISFIAMSQDRVNEAVTKISDDVILRIENATGWVKSKDGQWLEGENKIQNTMLSSTDMEKSNTGVYKVGQDNFEWIEVRNITVQGREFIIIIKKMQTHKDAEIYSLKENSKPAIAFVVFDNKEVKYNKVSSEYQSPLYYWSVINATADYIKDITAEMNALALEFPQISKSDGTIQNLSFYFKTSDNDPNIARFMLYTSKDQGMGHVLLPVPIPVGVFLSKKPLIDYYFELPTKKITTLVNILSK